MSKLDDIEKESHPCIIEGCDKMVPYDDEPTCYDHSPDSGSNVPGYSYKREAARAKERNAEAR